ncbi:hypothetical protein C0J29_28435 [Mycobacterium paragordonae]|jgi:hypothetical protein|uniref:Two-component sensor histidine kinase n=1 Tax=Mycobacterium paragordonae TaxID=1389713 RepID=A0ABQ1CBQ7_9MYCO|nr:MULTISPECIES: hypothetical protein [Mycobacterium]AYE98135.1 hypothetical protein C0J29_28435 [Mycobacterium paragordonae]OBJ85141.1 hypothetical protein A9W97_19785 [Mycobacterium gordonae]OBK53424.1 hypothetical protein A5656_23510 [Mycobacterium gordonae]GFG81938.1 hypothetical protein MPRG_52140 [Mycobacterium paragordonae]
MFTRFVLWLLVACIPALLMLATLGLGRLEKSLADDTVTASDVADFLNHAEAVDVRTLAREGMPEALELLHRRQALGLEAAPQPRALNGRHHVETFFAADMVGRIESGLPTRIGAGWEGRYRSSTQFTVTRHVNRV